MALIPAFLTRTLSLRASFFLAMLSISIPAAYADSCQELLNAANQNDRLAAGQAGNKRDADYFREAAQKYRTIYNQYCTGGSTSSSGHGGPSSNQKLDAVGNILGNAAGIAAIMDQKRQREEAARRELMLDDELKRLKREQEEAEASRKAAAGRADDERKRESMRKTMPNPFSNAVPKSDPSNPFSKVATGANSPKPPIAGGCLVVGETKKVTGSIGECTTKAGKKEQYHFTYIKSSMARGCPREIEFKYLDEDGVLQRLTTPHNVQTCGRPPLSVSVLGD